MERPIVREIKQENKKLRYEEKVDKYYKGEYLFPPESLTARAAEWSVRDWINFIDAKGKWL